MTSYDVEQILARRRVIRVNAANQADAVERARRGEGELIENEARCRLLTSDAQRTTKEDRHGE
jgi:hypothetical protein